MNLFNSYSWLSECESCTKLFELQLNSSRNGIMWANCLNWMTSGSNGLSCRYSAGKYPVKRGKGNVMSVVQARNEYRKIEVRMSERMID